jgi:hypothetical protein
LTSLQLQAAVVAVVPTGLVVAVLAVIVTHMLPKHQAAGQSQKPTFWLQQGMAATVSTP